MCLQICQQTQCTTAAWCAAVGMQINASKTVVMHMTAAAAPAYVWHCGGQALSCVQEARYLGMQFSSGASYLPTLGHLEKRLWQSYAVLRKQYGRLECSHSAWLLLQLHRTVSEIWGVSLLPGVTGHRNHLAAMSLRQIKHLARLRESVSTAIVYEELGVSPLQHTWLLRAARFWNSLAAGSDFYRQVALDSVRGALHGSRNWAFGLRSQLQAVGYGLQLDPNAMHPIEISALRVLLKAQLDAPWQGLHISPRLCPSQGAALVTYHRWFARPQHCHVDLLRQPLSAKAMTALLRFRTGCHSLPSVTGRWAGIARGQRLCPLCQSTFPDERHVVFECPHLDDLRQHYSELFQGPTTMLSFMWQGNVPMLAKFLRKCEDMMSMDTGPDAGLDN